MNRRSIIISAIIFAVILPAGISRAAGFILKFNDQTFPVSTDVINSWKSPQAITPPNLLNPPQPSLSDSLATLYGHALQTTTPSPRLSNFRLDMIYDYISHLSSQINTQVQEPKLTIVNNRATDFTPPQTGVELDVYQSSLNTLTALENNKTSAALVTYQTLPQTQLSQTNSLGINELVAEGVSKFNGSPNNRRHNIAVGITKFAGVLIPPGAQFSFDDNLGPVTAEAGFLPELVIKGAEGTIPELGGGLCQVSTTTFRAAMAAGLPITARRNHAYAVQYYSPQGTDATIYPGSADLKFINDTPGYIMIWPYEKDKNTLIFDFYGTKDDRQVTLEKPVVYDRQPDGSMKATWTRIVTKGSQTSTSTFKSIYQPPALFHKTESFVSATGTQSSGLKIPAKTN